MALAAASCGKPVDDPRGVDPGRSEGKSDRFGDCADCGLPPAVPLDGAPVTVSARWTLIGDGLTPSDDLWTARVEQGTDVVAWLGDHAIELDGDTLTLDVSDLPPGHYEVLFAERGATSAFASASLSRSFPLYVDVSIDWDGPDPPDANLRRQERLHESHPDLVLTHLVGPYTFTAGLSPERVDAILAWVTGMRDVHGDEIGLHIHPYCHFVEAAGVTCRRDPAFNAVEEARVGYTVFLFAYTEDETRRIFAHAKDLFAQHGLGTPTSFRAGAWAAQIHTLRALDAEGFVVDGSAVNWALLEEWEGNGPLFDTLRENWGPIDGSSQPYRPSRTDVLAAGADAIDLVELPDNGALVDYVRADEMIAVIEENLADGTLERPRVVSIGYHVDNFSESFFDRMDGALDFVDERLHAADGGPIVYVRMSDLAAIDWNAFTP